MLSDICQLIFQLRLCGTLSFIVLCWRGVNWFILNGYYIELYVSPRKCALIVNATLQLKQQYFMSDVTISPSLVCDLKVKCPSHLGIKDKRPHHIDLPSQV